LGTIFTDCIQFTLGRPLTQNPILTLMNLPPALGCPKTQRQNESVVVVVGRLLVLSHLSLELWVRRSKRSPCHSVPNVSVGLHLDIVHFRSSSVNRNYNVRYVVVMLQIQQNVVVVDFTVSVIIIIIITSGLVVHHYYYTIPPAMVTWHSDVTHRIVKILHHLVISFSR